MQRVASANSNPIRMSVRGSRSRLLDEPAPRAARMVALELLTAAAGARERSGDREDAAALHDFRVAVRRLRSWLHALRPWLQGSVPPRRRRQLRQVARGTNEARDAQVHLAWLARQRDLGRGKRADGVRWLVDQLEQERAHSDASSVARAAALFDRLHEPLGRSLGSYTLACRVDDPHCLPAMATAMAPLVRDHARTLRQRLVAVTTVDDDVPVHAARIAAKRLRYLLEPVAAELDGASELIDALRTLQTLLGEIHDAHLFATWLARGVEEAAAGDAPPPVRAVADAGSTGSGRTQQARPVDTGPGLRAVARRVRRDAAERSAELAAHWLDGNAEPFLADVEAVARRLESGGEMPVEIERKFLLDALPEVARGVPSQRLEQGYLPGTELVERVRRVTSADGRIRYWRTVKFGTGITRLELEEETTRAVFRALWPLTKRRRIDKRRHVVPDGTRKWEIDDFADRDLVLAEIELASEEDVVGIPDWLAPHVVREVTGEDAYVNANLASQGRPVPAPPAGSGGGRRTPRLHSR